MSCPQLGWTLRYGSCVPRVQDQSKAKKSIHPSSAVLSLARLWGALGAILAANGQRQGTQCTSHQFHNKMGIFSFVLEQEFSSSFVSSVYASRHCFLCQFMIWKESFFCTKEQKILKRGSIPSPKDNIWHFYWNIHQARTLTPIRSWRSKKSGINFMF